MDRYDLSEFRERIRFSKEVKTYDELSRMFGVNKFYLHEIVTKDDYTPPASVAAKLGIIVQRLAPACQDCGAVHTIDGVCIKKSKVVVTVYQVTPEELAAIEYPVTVIVKQSAGVQRKRARASINTEDPESAARTIRRKMDAETLAALLDLLKEGVEG